MTNLVANHRRTIACWGTILMLGTAALPGTAMARDPVKGPVVRTVLTMDSPLVHGEYAWDESGAPRDAPIRIVVDLASEKLHAYRGGVEIGQAYILYGADYKPTPTGRFKVLQKDRDHVSNLYGAPMPYMLRLTWDGVAIHGSQIDAGYATHGCVGVPDEFAALLYDATKMGSEVIVTRNWLPQFYDDGPAEVAAVDGDDAATAPGE